MNIIIIMKTSFYVGQGKLERAFVLTGSRRNNNYNEKLKM